MSYITSKLQRIRSRHLGEVNIMVMVDGTQEDFEELRRKIARTFVKHNRTSNRKVGYVIVKNPFSD